MANTQDDELIIIEDNNDSIDLWESDLIELDESKNEELISFDEPELETKIEESNTNLDVLEENNTKTEDILDFNLDTEADDKQTETIIPEKNENDSILDFWVNDENKIEEKEEVIEDKNSSFWFDLEDNEAEILNNTTETEDLNTILNWTILKLANRKETVNKKIEQTRVEISDIETEVKKLQDERKDLLAEVRELSSENKKIDENIGSLEEMKIWKENKTIKTHNSKRKPVNNKNYKKEEVAA